MTVAVVGAGLGGLRTCESLRLRGYQGRIVLVGEEGHLPYSRPPLSKEVLRGDKDATVATLRSPDELDALGIDLRLGRRAVALGAAERKLELDDGEVVGFDDLVIATGAVPRMLPGVTGERVHTLRTLDDALALQHVLVEGARLVVVGAGFIGLEVAASAVVRGCTVTVVDVLPTPLARVLAPELAAPLTQMHLEHGVTFRLGMGVSGLSATAGGVEVGLDDGSAVEADVVVVGIGVLPETGWLDGSGLTVDNGVVCDETLRAAPHVWAIGDVARWPAPSAGRSVRVEHWTNATEQADHVARAICGEIAAFDPVPYFWSDQYDAKLQSIGYAASGDEVAVVRGGLDERKWVALVRVGGVVAGVVGLRSAGQVMRLKPLLATPTPWAEALASVTA